MSANLTALFPDLVDRRPSHEGVQRPIGPRRLASLRITPQLSAPPHSAPRHNVAK
jgi:hypothetical protein